MSQYKALVICPKCLESKGNLVDVPVEDKTTIYELPVHFQVTCEWCFYEFTAMARIIMEALPVV